MSLAATYNSLVSDPNYGSDTEAQQLASRLQAKAAPIYQQLVSDPSFKSDTEAQQIAHQLRASGIVKDPTQGGLTPPQPAPQAPARTAPRPPDTQPAPSDFGSIQNEQILAPLPSPGAGIISRVPSPQEIANTRYAGKPWPDMTLGSGDPAEQAYMVQKATKAGYTASTMPRNWNAYIENDYQAPPRSAAGVGRNIGADVENVAGSLVYPLVHGIAEGIRPFSPSEANDIEQRNQQYAPPQGGPGPAPDLSIQNLEHAPFGTVLGQVAQLDPLLAVPGFHEAGAAAKAVKVGMAGIKIGDPVVDATHPAAGVGRVIGHTSVDVEGKDVPAYVLQQGKFGERVVKITDARRVIGNAIPAGERVQAPGEPGGGTAQRGSQANLSVVQPSGPIERGAGELQPGNPADVSAGNANAGNASVARAILGSQVESNTPVDQAATHPSAEAGSTQEPLRPAANAAGEPAADNGATPAPEKQRPPNLNLLNPDRQALIAQIRDAIPEDGQVHADEIAQKTGLSAQQVSTAATLGELTGQVRRLPGNHFERGESVVQGISEDGHSVVTNGGIALVDEPQMADQARANGGEEVAPQTVAETVAMAGDANKPLQPVQTYQEAPYRDVVEFQDAAGNRYGVERPYADLIAQNGYELRGSTPGAPMAFYDAQGNLKGILAGGDRPMPEPGTVPAEPYAPAAEAPANRSAPVRSQAVPEPRPAVEPIEGLTAKAAGPAYTSDNQPINYHWEIRPVSELVTSNNDAFGERPDYDQGLQPRDRDRAGMIEQVLAIARNPVGGRLAESPSTADGAPIVGADMQVESGNGRTMGVRMAYANGGPEAEAYRQSVLDAAVRLGMDTGKAAGVKDPVLVRVRDTEVPEGPQRYDLARRMGLSSVASMSEPEKAAADAQRVLDGDLLAALPPDVTDLNSAAARPFVRGFMQGLPISERTELEDPNGGLSVAGLRRVRNAMLAAAYGKGEQLSRMTESLDDNVRGVGNGMVLAAPAFARLRRDIAAGDRYPGLDITPDIAEAANTLSYLRDVKRPVTEHLATASMFNSMSPVAETLLRVFDQYKARPKVIAAILQEYARGAELAGDPKQGNMFGEAEIPSADSVLTAAVRRVQEDGAEATRVGQSTLELSPQTESSPRPNTPPAPPGTAPGGTAPSPPIPSRASPSDLTLQSAVIPGGKEFIEQDVIPTLSKGVSGLAAIGRDAKEFISPASMSKEAATTANITREHVAVKERQYGMMQRETDQARKAFDTAGTPASLDFIDRQETGKAQPTTALTKTAAALNAIVDGGVQEVRSLGTGKLETLIANYFPHYWKDPKAAADYYNSAFGKRPMEGPRTFLKQRSIPTMKDGMSWRVNDETGAFVKSVPDEASATAEAAKIGGSVGRPLTPVTTNPVELAMMKRYDMDRYVMAHRVMQEMKSNGLLKFVRSTTVPDPGWTKIDDHVATVYGQPSHPGALQIEGHYYAPDDAARIINNYLSPGLAGKPLIGPIYRSLRAVGNLMNQAQLGLSAFHVGFTTMDSITSKAALAAEQASRGNFGGAAVSAVKAAIPGYAPIEALMQGNKVLKEYWAPGTQGGDFAQIVDSLMAGGGRVAMDKFYQVGTAEKFLKAARSGNYPGAILRAPFAAMDSLSGLLMKQWVPRLKLGIFADMAREELARLPAGASRDDVRAAMGRAWDSVDNRMGQLVYDNLFWDKTLKDSLLLSTRSVGWNLGTIRELGGGVLDTATLPKRLLENRAAGNQIVKVDPKTGKVISTTQIIKQPLVTHRMAYLFALPFVAAAYGAIYQYLRTGQGPQELKDYFMPKTGRLTPDGNPERVQLPTYMKDIGSYSRDPVQTVMNKAHPLLSAFYDMAHNQDYYGTEIHNPDDPLVKQVQQEAGFVAQQFEPYSFQGGMRLLNQGDVPGAVGAGFGIMPAPAVVTRTAAENLMADYIARHYGGAQTPEQAARGQIVSQIAQGERQGKDVSDLIDQFYGSGASTRSLQSAVRAGTMTADEARFKRLTLQEAINVYDQAKPSERAAWKDLLAAKAGRTTMPISPPMEKQLRAWGIYDQ